MKKWSKPSKDYCCYPKILKSISKTKQNEACYGKKQKDSKYKKPSDNYEEVSKPLKLLDKDDIKLRSIWDSKLHWANKNYPHFEEYSQIAEKEFK